MISTKGIIAAIVGLREECKWMLFFRLRVGDEKIHIVLNSLSETVQCI